MDAPQDFAEFEADVADLATDTKRLEDAFSWNDKFATAKAELDMLRAHVACGGPEATTDVFNAIANAGQDALRFMLLAAIAPNARCGG